MQLGGSGWVIAIAFLQLGITGVAFAAAADYCPDPVWQDEFDGDSLSTDKWQIVEGDGCDQSLCGWGNKELQWYSEDNVQVSDGVLSLVARNQPTAETAITSGKISTQGKFSKRFGRIEARIQLPSRLGTWPAFWMMPEGKRKTWPVEGEIDILEQGGRNNDDLKQIIGTVHFGPAWPDNRHKSHYQALPKAQQTGFQVYAIEWDADSIRWFINDTEYGRATPATLQPDTWPFNDMPFHLILNLAVGGTLGGDVDESVDGAKLGIDYVRVYELCDKSGSAAQLVNKLGD